MLVFAPGLSEQGGQEAKEFIEDIGPAGSKIIIDEDNERLTGKHDPIIAKITCNGINLNEILLDGGHCMMYTRYCDRSEFSDESWATECQ